MSEPLLRVEPGSLEESLLRQIDRSRMPRHVAIIMDGNGRWAGKRFLPRIEGHRAGVQAVRETVESAARLGLEVLTLYAFSIENWKRPRHEVWTLMNLLKEFLRREIRTLVDNDIRLRVLGRWRELDPSVVATLEEALAKTASGQRMVFNIALNYSGRCEIVDACRRLAERRAAGEAIEIDEATISAALETAGLPDPDLLIRTSGEMRVSNFLLWQIAYSEIVVTPTLWPDFRLRHLLEAIVAFQGRERRFGGIEAPTGLAIAAPAEATLSPGPPSATAQNATKS
jgi:undecaprenyl diphosphate synthase